jgi:hypothetical protein
VVQVGAIRRHGIQGRLVAHPNQAALVRAPMTTDWSRDQLARFSYRPGWRLSIEPGISPWTSGTLLVRYRAPDSNHPERTTLIKFRTALPPADAFGGREELFAEWLQSTLLDLEWHESREWLRRDGEIYDNPHGPGSHP